MLMMQPPPPHSQPCRISGPKRRKSYNNSATSKKYRTPCEQLSFPMEDLREHSPVLELQGMGDDDDKAFLIGLILIRMYEYRRAQGEVRDLQHLLVIEEAHRLLTNVESTSHEQGNPRGKAVE